ncbi:MAG: PAS domain S-box protein [Xenococcaceae cyanobacterium]
MSIYLSNLEQLIEYDPIAIAPDTLLIEAIALMSNGSDCVLIVINKKPIGILTKGDVVRLVAKKVNLASTTVETVMTQPVLSITRARLYNIEVVWSFLQQNKVSYIPIVGDKQELIGVINSSSLIQFLRSPKLEFALNNSIYSQKKLQSFHQTNTVDLARFFQITPSMLCIAGFDGYFKLINPAFSEILGFTQTELLAEPFISFVHPEDRAATIFEVENLIAGKTTISFENRYSTKNGDYRWLLWTAKSYLEEKIICAAARDITERKKTEQALKESEFRWQLALRGANDGLWDWNVKTNEVFFSRRWKEMLGFADNEIDHTLEEWTKRVHPEDINWVTQLIQNHFARKTPFYISEHRVQCKDGSYKWILDRGQALWDEKGNVVRMTGSHTDISARKRAEIQLKQERDFSNAIINTVGALIAVLDRQGTIMNFNRTCEQITGYSFQEVRGKQIWEFLIAPEEKEAVRAVFRRLIAGQIPNNYNNYWVTKDGSRRLISWSNTALFNNRGNVEFIITTGIDITEQQKVWHKLEHQYRQTKLLAEITHKIRMSIDLQEILQTTVTEIQHLLACDRVLIVKIQAHNTALFIKESVTLGITPMLGYEIADPLLVGDYLEKYRQGKILAINNLAVAPIDSEIKQLLEQFQVQAKLVVPILGQSKLRGLLVIHQCQNPRQWQDEEIRLLNQLANQLGVALSQAHLLKDLEELVSERTTELTNLNQVLQAEIAEHRKTEAALRENQQKLTGILDNADEAIISIDEQQNIQLFNKGAEKIFGYQAREVRGQPLDILLPNAFRQAHRQHIDRFGQSPETARIMAQRRGNVYGLRKQGQEFPAEASIAKLWTKDGLVFTVMLKDITEQQQAKEKLQASKALLSKAEKIAKMGSWEYSSIDKQLSWSEELFEILEFSPPAIPPYSKILERIHPEDLLLVTNTFRQGRKNGQLWQFHFRWVSRYGTIKYLESRGEPTVDSQGKVLKVGGTIMDISDRIKAEKAFQRSEKQLRLITDALPVLIAYIDNQQRYRYNNQTYETWFGKPRSELKGLSIAALFGKDNYQKILPYIKTALEGKTVTFEIEFARQQGNAHWVNATYVPDIDSEGAIKGFFSMMNDITERKEVEQMKSEFISIASHEMRTPLTSIHGVIKLLCAERLGELSPSGREMANLALRNSDRLVNLVNDILDLERMESGRDEINKQLCNSGELIEQALDAVSSMAQAHRITFETNSSSIEFQGDRDLLVQTLINLLSNAIKFSPEGSQVWITAEQKDEEVLFTVRDRGRGIPSDKLEMIFERFQQVDASDSRKKGGTGLGLAICRHIVEQHGGNIWVESVYGEGSIFFFTLPFVTT